MISFNFVPTKEDYFKSFQTMYKKRILIFLLVTAFILPEILCVLLNYLGQGEQIQLVNIFPFILAILFLMFFPIYYFVINPFISSRKAAKDERLSGIVHYEVNDEYILVKTKYAESKLDWGNFQSVIESKAYFLLLCTSNKNMFQMIPKRAFVSLDDELAFKSLLNTHIQKKVKNNFQKNKSMIILIILLSIVTCVLATISYLNAG